jgi:hypothetical protein
VNMPTKSIGAIVPAKAASRRNLLCVFCIAQNYTYRMVLESGTSQDLFSQDMENAIASMALKIRR